MKKVFSMEKFLKWRERFGSKEWWEICDGLTEEEISKLGYTTSDNWMVEVEDEQED